MTSSTLAARIGALTQSIDNLEVLHASMPTPNNTAAESRRNVLDTEIALLHALLDQLNADYEAQLVTSEHEATDCLATLLQVAADDRLLNSLATPEFLARCERLTGPVVATPCRA